MKFCIDAGHGKLCINGSPDGKYKESEFTLDVALRIQKEIIRHGHQVIMTRTNETDVTLAGRTNLSNKNNCDYYISLHTNASGKEWSSASGFEVYVVSLGGKAEQLAKKVEKHCINEMKCKSRGVKTANYYVVKYTECPAILIEYGFHTNQDEVKLLSDNEYRQKCAESTVKGLFEQCGISYVEAEKPLESKQWALSKGISDNNWDKTLTKQEMIDIIYQLR